MPFWKLLLGEVFFQNWQVARNEFVLTYFFGGNPSEIIIRKLLVFLLVFMVLGILSITAFFTGHYLGFF